MLPDRTPVRTGQPVSRMSVEQPDYSSQLNGYTERPISRSGNPLSSHTQTTTSMADEPPSYETSFLDVKNSSSSSAPSFARNEKDPHGENSPPIASTSKSAALLRTPAPLPRNPSPSPTRKSFLTGLRDAFRTPESAHDPAPDNTPIESAVMDDLRTVVKSYTDSTTDRVDLLEICARLCARHKIDFSFLLQEKTIKDHTALYWAIVNGPWPPRAPFELVAAVLAHSAPLKSKAIRETRRACISLRSQEMFQFLRTRPEFGVFPEEDQFLLNSLVPPEEIVVEEMGGANEPFSVKFRIPQFLKRMSLSRRITLEFIARGRLWRLSFFTAINPTSAWLKTGGWAGSLAITDSSPSTHVEFGLVCFDARPSPPTPSAENFWVHCSSDKPLYARNEPGKPENGISGWSWAMFERDNPCIASDGSVSGMMGVKLGAAKAYTPRSSWPETVPTTADAECVIC